MALTEQPALARLHQIQQLAPFIHQSMAFSGAASADLGGAERVSLVVLALETLPATELALPFDGDTRHEKPERIGTIGAAASRG